MSRRLDLWPLAATNGLIRAMILYDPPGPIPTLLIIGGEFSVAGTVPASNVAAWDGAVWRALGEGTNGPVKAFTIQTAT